MRGVRTPALLGSHFNIPENGFPGTYRITSFAIVTCSQLKFSGRVFCRLDEDTAAICGTMTIVHRYYPFTCAVLALIHTIICDSYCFVV